MLLKDDYFWTYY